VSLIKRIEKAEAININAKYARVVFINQGEKLPGNVGPATIIIIDDIPKRKPRK